MTTLLADPTNIANRLGIEDPTPTQVARISEVIQDVQDDVEAYLNRPLFPTQQTLTAIYPVMGQDLNSWRAWPEAQQFDDRVSVVSYVSHPDGSYDVTFNVGIDATQERRVIRYVSSHALENVRVDPDLHMGTRPVFSLSAEGQSVSYGMRRSASGRNGSGADEAGSLPNIDTLKGLRRYAIYSRDRANVSIWPYDGIRYVDSR